jgi:hypothetical protein
MSEVVTILQIDANTSGADQFSDAMDKAAASTKSFNESQRETFLAIAGVGTSIIAAVVAGNQFLDYVGKANKELADMSAMANRVGLSLADLQGVKFGGLIEGLSNEQINSGLQKSAELLNDASRNSNTLSKELAQNGISVRNSNGSLITQNQLLGIAADLIAKARNPGDQDVIAKMLGFTKEWIPLLQQGSGAMAGLTSEAERAGVVIDEQTIERAADFDKKWRRSSVEFASYMKSAMVGLLPYLDDLIDGASKFVKSIDRATIEKKSKEQLDALAGPVGLQDDLALKIEVTPDATNAVKDIQDAGSLWSSIATTLRYVVDVTNGSKGMFNVSSLDPASVPGYAASKITEPSYPNSSQMDAAFDRANPADPGSRAKPLAGLSASDYEAMDGFSKVARNAADANDKVDAAINTLRRHTEQQEADTKAIGLGAGALALFRAQAAETSAVQANGGKENAEQAAKFKLLQIAAQDAAIAFEKVNVAYNIKRGRDTAFLSTEDVAIANQLRLSYPDVAAAISSVEANAIRANTAMRGISTMLETNLTTGLTDAISGAKSFGQAMADTGKIVVRALEEAIVKLLIIRPLMASLGGGGGGLLGLLGIGGTAQGPMPDGSVVGSANGNAFYGGNVIPFARGGVIDGPMMAPMALMGEAGPEAIVPLRRGPDGNLGIAGGGGGGTVTVQGGDTHITIEGNADEKTLNIMKQELARRDAEMHTRVVVAVTQARKMRQL